MEQLRIKAVLPGEADGLLYITGSIEEYRRLRARGEAAIWDLDEGGYGFMEPDYAITDIENADYDYLERVYRRIRGLPVIIAQGENWMLRELMPGDGVALDALYERILVAEGGDFIEKPFRGPWEAEAYVVNYIKNIYGLLDYGMWVCQLKETQETEGVTAMEGIREGLIARVGFEPDSEGLKLGYMTDPAYRRRGMTRALCQAAIQYAHHNMPDMEIGLTIHRDNRASIALADKLDIAAARLL